VTIACSGATVGTNEYISAVIVDSSNGIKYYGSKRFCAEDSPAYAHRSDTEADQHLDLETDSLPGTAQKNTAAADDHSGRQPGVDLAIFAKLILSWGFKVEICIILVYACS